MTFLCLIGSGNGDFNRNCLSAFIKNYHRFFYKSMIWKILNISILEFGSNQLIINNRKRVLFDLLKRLIQVLAFQVETISKYFF